VPSGTFFPASGLTGGDPCTSSNLRPWSDGTNRDSASTGDGRVATDGQVGRKCPEKCEGLSDRCLLANPLWGAPRIHGELLKLGIDFFTVPTATFQVLYVFLVLDNARRRIIHFNVTDSPSAAWTGQQIVEAYPWETAPRYVIILNERHLRRVLRKYLDYYHRNRTHLGLEKDCPETRAVELPEIGPIASEPVLGELHHLYFRQAA